MELTRRSALAGLSLAAAAPLAGVFAPSALAQAGTRAPRLRPGDKVGLIAPAGFLSDRSELELVQDTMRAMRLEPVTAPNVLSRFGYLAGTDAERADSVNTMFRNPDLAAVFAVRGGWGCARILPLLDYDAIRANPKVFAGYSDITALHLAFAAKGIGYPTVHGPTAGASWPQAAWKSFEALAFEAQTPTYRVQTGTADRLVQREGRTHSFGKGRARGRLLGGNLTVMSALAGTPYLPDFTGAILFLEDIDEAPYRIDRMLTQLRLAGILGRLNGIVFGQCTNCATTGASLGDFTLYEVLEQHLAPLGIPAFSGAMIGHVSGQVSMPVNAMAEIDADAGTISLLEPVVA